MNELMNVFENLSQAGVQKIPKLPVAEFQKLPTL